MFYLSKKSTQENKQRRVNVFQRSEKYGYRFLLQKIIRVV